MTAMCKLKLITTPEDNNDKEVSLGGISGFYGIIAWVRLYQHFAWQRITSIHTIDGAVAKRLYCKEKEEKASRGVYRFGELPSS